MSIFQSKFSFKNKIMNIRYFSFSSWENASAISFSNSFIKKYEKKIGRKLLFPKKRKYFVKKVVVNNESSEVKEISNEYYKLQSELKKL